MSVVFTSIFETKRVSSLLAGINQKKQLKSEIAQLEGRLDDMGVPGNDLYKRAIVNMYRGLICAYKEQLNEFSRSRCA